MEVSGDSSAEGYAQARILRPGAPAQPILGRFEEFRYGREDPDTNPRGAGEDRCLWASRHPEHLKLLEAWLKSYRPQELFDDQGRLRPGIAELAPRGNRRMGANPHANGGALLRDLRMPDYCDYALEVRTPGVQGIRAGCKVSIRTA